jgi:hypothetical protein
MAPPHPLQVSTVTCFWQYGLPSRTVKSPSSGASQPAALHVKWLGCHTFPSAVTFCPVRIGSPHLAHASHTFFQHSLQYSLPSAL